VAEGDTILRAERRLTPALTGQTLTVSAPNPRGRVAGVERLDGRVLERIDTHGKNLLFRFSGGLVMHSHLGMNGGWQVVPHEAPAWRRPLRSAWVVLDGDSHAAAQFGGPTLRVLTAGRLALDPRLQRLGPDILAPEFDLDAVLPRVQAADQSRTLGETLLDQTLVAGIGNIYKCESCFASRLSPWRRLAETDVAQRAETLSHARELMMDAVITGDRGTFLVYGHRGPCSRCGGRVRSRGQGDANRITWWCDRCQR
jgi:endonuclease-8